SGAVSDPAHFGEGFFACPALERLFALTPAASPREREEYEHSNPDQAAAEEDRDEAVSLRDVFVPLVLQCPQIDAVRVAQGRREGFAAAEAGDERGKALFVLLPQ